MASTDFKIRDGENPNDRGSEQTARESDDRTSLQDEIAQAAYGLFLARGCEDGQDVDDWIEAERQVLERRYEVARRAHAADGPPDPATASPAAGRKRRAQVQPPGTAAR